MFAGNDRHELRAVFFAAWRKHLAGEPLEGAERLIAQVAGRHPEYHGLLADESAGKDRDYPPVHGGAADTSSLTRGPRLNPIGETNPFLHMAMHIAIEEGLLLDEPRGIREHYRALLAREGDEHEAQHRMMDCLAEMLWQAQRAGRAPDTAAYLDCLSRLTGC